MQLLEMILLCASGVFMGIVAVTAGGGATVGIPLVLLFGYPVNVSVVAVKFGLVGSFLSGMFAYRGASRTTDARLPFHVWPLAVAGAALGANLVLKMQPNVLKFIIFVLLAVTLILSVVLKPSKDKQRTRTSPLKRALGAVVIFALCVYSGFFGPGFGTFLLFALMYFYGFSYLEGAAAGTSFALLVVGTSVVIFLMQGAVSFAVAIPVATGCMVGGFAGAKLARRGGDGFIRRAFIAVTVLLILKLGYEMLR